MKKWFARTALCLLAIIVVACVLPDELLDSDTAEQQQPLPIPTADPGEALPSPLCADPHPSLITDIELRKPPPSAEPAPRSPFRARQTFTSFL